MVIDDDAAVRTGLVRLLDTWGVRTTAFGDAAALAAWLASSPGAAPDFAIVDHRLVEPGDGLAALERLRAAWPGATLPAVLVTGSLLDAPPPAREGGANAALYLLRKPVAPARLRALLGSLLTSPGTGATPP